MKKYPSKLFRLSLSVGVVGLFLFFHVWWPIQAERADVQLKFLTSNLAQKKADLRDLSDAYSRLVSLSHLDQWAKNNGPWHIPRHADVITITN